VRKALALALCFAIQAAGLSAPLVHAHPDDHVTEHHAGGAIHAHWSGHAGSHHHSDGPAIEAADYDRAVFLNAFVAVGASPSPAPAVTPDAAPVRVPEERPAHRITEITHGHDPPAIRSVPPRAPPAHLS
jgi:hypothetical protein